MPLEAGDKVFRIENADKGFAGVSGLWKAGQGEQADTGTST